jgi:hypothetical protein
VLQLALPRSAEVRVEDRPWSEGYAYGLAAGVETKLPIHLYNFAAPPAKVRLTVVSKPDGWNVSVPDEVIEVPPESRTELTALLQVPPETRVQDAWIVLRADGGALGRSPLAFRVRVSPSRRRRNCSTRGVSTLVMGPSRGISRATHDETLSQVGQSFVPRLAAADYASLGEVGAVPRSPEAWSRRTSPSACDACLV